MSEEQGSGQTPAPSENSLSDVMDNYDMGVDPATGEFTFTPAQTPVEGAAAQGSPPVEGGETPTQAGDAVPTEDSPAGNDLSTLNKRLKDNQAALTRANQEKANLQRRLDENSAQYDVLNVRVDSVMDMLEKAQKGNRQQNEPSVDDPNFEGFENPQQLKAYLDSQVELRAKEMVSKIVPEGALKKLSQEYEIRTELQEAMQAYPDFPQYAEEVRLVINTRPQLTFKQAYEIVQHFKGQGNSLETPNAPTGGATPQGNTPAAPTGTVEGAVSNAGGQTPVDNAIADRARRLGNVEHPSSGGAPGRGPVKSVADAVERALEEMNAS